MVLIVVIVVAGDASSIRIGSETNIQDHSLISVGGNPFSSGKYPTVIGNKVTVGECPQFLFFNQASHSRRMLFFGANGVCGILL